MDIQVQELIDKIKQDGIENASKAAQSLRDEAEVQAQKIVEKAKAEATKLVEAAQAEVARIKTTSQAALEQAARNAILSLQAKIQEIFTLVIQSDSATALNSSALNTLAPEILGKLLASGQEVGELLLSEGDFSKLEASLRSSLSKELSKGMEIKPVKDLDAGLRIVAKDGGAYWDFSAQSLANILATWLNPRLAETMQKAIRDL